MRLPEHTLALTLGRATSSESLNIYGWFKFILLFSKHSLLVRIQLFSFTKLLSLITNKQLMNVFKKKKFPLRSHSISKSSLTSSYCYTLPDSNQLSLEEEYYLRYTGYPKAITKGLKSQRTRQKRTLKGRCGHGRRAELCDVNRNQRAVGGFEGGGSGHRSADLGSL